MREDFLQELIKIDLNMGILNLFNEEKRIETEKKHFKEIGRLNEYLEYENTAHQKIIKLFKKHFHELTEQNIHLQNGFLYQNNEPIAIIDTDITPLKGRKQKLEEILDKFIELTYPEDDYFLNLYIKLPEKEELDLEEEIKRRNLEEQIKREEVKYHILTILTNSKEKNHKKLKLIPYKKLETPTLTILENYDSKTINSAIKELEEEIEERKIKTKLNLLKKKLNKKNKVALGLLALAFLSTSLYFGGQQLIQQLTPIPEEKKEPYKEVGGTDSEIKAFLTKYPWAQNVNKTNIDFFLSWKKNPKLADKTFDAMKNVKESVEYLNLSNDYELLLEALNNFGWKAIDFVKFVEENKYRNAVAFLREFPQFKNNYEKILPAYSKAPNVVRTCYDQVERDSTILFNKIYLFLELMEIYSRLNITDSLPLKAIQVLNNATAGGIHLNLPKMTPTMAQALIDVLLQDERIVDLSPNVQKSKLKDVVPILPHLLFDEKLNITYQIFDEKLNTTDVKFIYYFLAQLSSSNYESVSKYPIAAREFAKQVDQLLLPPAGKIWPGTYPNYTWNDVRSNWEKIASALSKLWRTQVEIWEKGEGFLPLDEKLARSLFNDSDVLEVLWRETLLPREILYASIIRTNTGKVDSEVTNNPSLDTFLSNIEKYKDYHDLFFKALKYKPNTTDDLIFFVVDVLGINNPNVKIWANYWKKMLEYPDPIKIFLISWNRSLSGLMTSLPITTADSVKFREVLIENGTEVPWVNLSIRGNETLSPEMMTTGSTVEGIAPVKFREGNVRWEQMGFVIPGLAMYISEPLERQVTSVLIGWALLYPICLLTYDCKTRLYPFPGFHVTDKTYEILKTVGDPVIFPFQSITGWPMDWKNVRSELYCCVFVPPGTTGFLDVKFCKFIPET